MKFNFINKKVIDNVANKLSNIGNKLNNSIEEESIKDGLVTLSNYKYDKNKYYLYYKIPSAKFGSLIKGLTNPVAFSEKYSKYKCVICDDKENVKYYTSYDESLVSAWYKMTLFNDNQKSIGNIKLVKMFEDECTIYYGEEKISRINYSFNTYEGKIKIKVQEHNKTEFIVFIEEKEIAKINLLPSKFGEGLVDKYIIEYDDKNNEELVVLISCAIDLIRESYPDKYNQFNID